MTVRIVLTMITMMIMTIATTIIMITVMTVMIGIQTGIQIGIRIMTGTAEAIGTQVFQIGIQIGKKRMVFFGESAQKHRFFIRKGCQIARKSI